MRGDTVTDTGKISGFFRRVEPAIFQAITLTSPRNRHGRSLLRLLLLSHPFHLLLPPNLPLPFPDVILYAIWNLHPAWPFETF